jgi:carboxypeptidase Taq
MSGTTSTRYREVMERAAELADLESAVNLVGWDQETMMPPKGVDGRAPVAATMAGIYHERLTDPALVEMLGSLSEHGDGLGEVERAQIAELRRIQDRAVKLPRKLVRALAEIQSRATAVWARAREDKDFPAFAPLLEETYRLKREVAATVGFEGEPYDALLDEFEPGAKTAEIAAILEDVREFLVPVVAAIGERDTADLDAVVAGPFDPGVQDAVGRDLIKAMGFDMEAGRLDQSEHPFTMGVHAGDTRLTTRYKDDITVGLFGTLHEAGHGLYEQNLGADLRRTPLGPASSLGIHESQSRMWENMVGRSLPYWTHFYPALQKAFPQRLGKVPLDTFYRAVNMVRPSFIRIEADEVTYNLHIVLRFELERELITERLTVRDLPGAWNDRMKTYLGITPPSPDLGVLQDIHWAGGMVGYFPTYTLGNLYAAQLYEGAERGIPDLEARIARGELLPLRDWLVENVHRWGRRYPAAELIRRATGAPPSAEPYRAYIREKFGRIYGL